MNLSSKGTGNLLGDGVTGPNRYNNINLNKTVTEIYQQNCLDIDTTI